MEKNYYVYEYIRLDTNEIFYVGKGKGDRCYSLHQRNEHFTNIVNEIPCAVTILKDNLTESQAFALEEKRIHQLVFEEGYSIDIKGARSVEKGQHLVNATWGGEGTSGHKPTEESKAKMSERKKGENNPMKRPEVRAKKSEAMKGENNPMYGKKRPEMKGENHPNAKKVICLKNNIPIAQFNTIAEATEWLGKSSSVMISKCCSSSYKLKTAYGYKWTYITIIEL